jgi:serine/threonine-protein kinase ATR
MRSKVSTHNRANGSKSALCLWTSPDSWPLQVVDTRKELCTNITGCFSDTQLLKDSALPVKAFRALNLTNDERPAKRRKTLPDSSDDISKSTYEQLVLYLNGSVHDSPVHNLANLHNIVQ